MSDPNHDRGIARALSEIHGPEDLGRLSATARDTARSVVLLYSASVLSVLFGEGHHFAGPLIAWLEAIALKQGEVTSGPVSVGEYFSANEQVIARSPTAMIRHERDMPHDAVHLPRAIALSALSAARSMVATESALSTPLIGITQAEGFLDEIAAKLSDDHPIMGCRFSAILQNLQGRYPGP
jgi:hypothetical protein